MFRIRLSNFTFHTHTYSVHIARYIFEVEIDFYFHILWDFYWLCPPVLLQIAVLTSLGFMVCWSPYSMVSLWSIFGDSSTIPPEVSLLPCMFAKSSTVYNPMIYYIFSQHFKREVKQLWLCPGSNPCHGLTSNSINDTDMHMVSADIKSKAEVLSTLPEIAEWKTEIFWIERQELCSLIMCYLTNVTVLALYFFPEYNGVCYYNITSRVMLASFVCGHDEWEGMFAQYVKCCGNSAN